jgi:3'(2'), 5'-bisphosphate nucleotidase
MPRADDLSRELSLSRALCRRAAEVIMAVYRTDFDVDWKSPRDPVTAADRDANALIVDALSQAFPDDAICAEEASEESAAEASARGGRCWFVDPLDGTREFVDRNGEFCVMIGLAIDGVARLGAVYAPVWGRAWSGVPGLGAWEHTDDGHTRTLCVEPAAELSMVVSRSHPHPEVMRLADTLGAARVVPCGGVGLKVAKVVSGEVALYAQLATGPKLWDGCAPEAIARGAGAVMTDAQGRAIRYDTPVLGLDAGIVVAHPALAARALAALRG